MIKNVLKFADRAIWATLPHKAALQYRYLTRNGRMLRLSKPKLFNEKIYHRMAYPSRVLGFLSDKIAVRDYVRDRIGEKYLIPLLGSYKKITNTDLATLPQSFVLKGSHGAGFNLIVLDKFSEDFETISEQANSWLSIDYGKITREKHYSYVEPRLLAEKLMLDNGAVPLDYKVNWFGRSKQDLSYIQVDHGRYSGERKQLLYRMDGTPAPFKLKGIGEYAGQALNLAPEILDEMGWVCERLAEPFGYVRVDLYIIQEEIYFGELTFTPSGGNRIYTPSNW